MKKKVEMAEINIVPLTQETCNLSSTTYLWVYLFSRNVNEEYPFSVVPLHIFQAGDFPMKLINGPLTDKDRIQEYELRNLASRRFSIFAKIERG